MICSCLAADGKRSKSGGVLTGREPRCDWLPPSTVWDNGQVFGPANGLPAREAAIG